MPQRRIKTYCRSKIAPRAHFLDAEGHAVNCKLDCLFASDVMSGCHAFYNAPRCCSHMSLLLSVVFGLLGISACSLSIIETAYDMVVVYIY